MNLKEKETEFDEELRNWAEKHKKERQEYWGEDWYNDEYWTYIDKEGKEKYYTEAEKSDYCFTPIIDGSMRAEEYENNKSAYRVLFVAKEPYDPDGDIGSYRDNSNYGNAPRFWEPAQRVAYGIFNNKEHYSETKINNYADLTKTAYVNVQKYRARSSTNSRYLRDWYLNKGCKELLDKQLEILNPNIIICLYTCDIIWESIDAKYKMEQHNYKSLYYNIFAGKQRPNEEAVTSAYFTKEVLCVDCFHLSKPGLNQDVWGQGILQAFLDWKEYLSAECYNGSN